MYGKGRIIPALIIFIGLMTAPMWYGSGDASKLPNPEKPKGYTECVEDTQYMRTSHMKVLNDWRDDILREGGARVATTANGTEYVRSLQNGCMKCHNNREKFCGECHKYASVNPYCWDCHLQPKEAM
ncbi:MAG: sulfate reduction electron transfer complex DsrMKJOP subunit DsrJ [Desulfobulbaceae bacterium]|nr:sulfate reduction electron transfer complex DsrMKJOP subunit DsrJ [Desulfobulbaceae bacterium]HIJ79609.1 sulfate reduction electron transfer complex DsrMKJOP subunit DsrJ [Deltaproteobacteria bacterium]